MVSEAFVAEMQNKRVQLTQVIESTFEQEDKSQYYFHEHTQNSFSDTKLLYYLSQILNISYNCCNFKICGRIFSEWF